jgi:hypothetical protein
MTPTREQLVGRARRYLAKMPPAISGSGGHAAAFKAALVLLKGFALTMDEAFRLLLVWNEQCVPAWSESELRHKLVDAAKSNMPEGYLLKGELPREMTDKATKRLQWPLFTKPETCDIEVIASLRGLSPDSVYLVATHNHLWRCRWRDAECFAIRFGGFAQVRRMDGQYFAQKSGSPVKALNLPGSEGAFLNPGGLGGNSVPVIMTEGVISIIEAAEAILRADSALNSCHGYSILAAVSAGSRFNSSTLVKLSGRQIRIIADSDNAGIKAAAVWKEALIGAGCSVDCVKMPEGLKDLGEAIKAIPPADPFWHKLLAF